MGTDPASAEQDLYKFLESLAIPFRRYTHPPVYTVDEAEKHWQGIDGAHCKNLFLRNHKGKQHYLVILPHWRRADLKELGAKLGESRLSFASEQRLDRFLGLTPGAVSPFGLINDRDGHIVVVIDAQLRLAEGVCFHPNVNTATIGISFADFERFLHRCGNEVRFLQFGE